MPDLTKITTTDLIDELRKRAKNDDDCFYKLLELSQSLFIEKKGAATLLGGIADVKGVE